MGCLPMTFAALLQRVRVYGPERLKGLRFARLARWRVVDRRAVDACAAWVRKWFGSRLVMVYRGSARVAAAAPRSRRGACCCGGGSRVMVGTDGGLFELNGKGQFLCCAFHCPGFWRSVRRGAAGLR